ncbi:DUF6382 domain-containing protein [Bacillus kwashiorkori]|uniref:DUF6382 domain-containing protein n=1 Tax=Bacillus kwashiorkori TaxID=1522318 RepID=UPI00078020A0|nr:DUF6382 domain-containing protein [Bacillus kwashiorkori]
MKHTIYQLEYDFASSNGQFMVFHKKENNPLTTKDLSNLQIRMIESNQIPRLLPMRIDEIDFNVKINYNIQSKRMLRLYIKERPLTMEEYYLLFLNMIKVLEDSNIYMLKEENYLINEELIYVGKDINDVYLTYVPVEKINRNRTILEDLRQLMIDIAGEVHGLDGNSFKMILNYIKSSGFSIAGIKEILIGLHSNQPMGQVQMEHAPLNNQFSYQQGQHQPIKLQETKSTEEVPPSYEDLMKQKQKQKKKKQAVKKMPLPPLTSREGTYLFAAIALFSAIIWKVYLEFSNTIMLVISSVSTVAFIALGFIYWKIWRPGVKREIIKVDMEEESTETVDNTKNKSAKQEVAVSHQYAYNYPQVSSKTVSNPINPFPQSQNYGNVQQENAFINKQNQNNHSWQDQNMGTSFNQSFMQPQLPLSDETILLEDDMDQINANGISFKRPSLEINRQGKIERVMIDEDHFIIGRHTSGVHYQESATGVSRLHLEFIKIDENCGVKDLGSKNGSKLNDKQMVPYKIYALKDNDKIKIGSVTYTFKWSKEV